MATPTELAVNARIAANLGAPVLLSVRATGRTPAEIASVVELSLAELNLEHAHAAAVVANRCEPARMDAVLDACKDLGPSVYVLPRGTVAGRSDGRRIVHRGPGFPGAR